jgi:endonuclease/exonuclease/phosphatase family metal-dependent hydrolase
VTVASLNLHHGVSRNGTPFGVTAALCQLDTTIICVQEAWQPSGKDGADSAAIKQSTDIMHSTGGQHSTGGDASEGAEPDASDQLADAAAKLGMSVHRAAMYVRPSGELAIAVLTALPVTAYEVVELGTAPGDTIPRLAQIVLLELPAGGRLRLVNTHLTHRFTSAVQLFWLQRRLKPGPPTIIVGDLNMPRTIAARWPGYADQVRGRTFPAERPLIQLDHVLAGHGIERVSGSVLPHVGSDHLPIRAEIRITGAGRSR